MQMHVTFEVLPSIVSKEQVTAVRARATEFFVLQAALNDSVPDGLWWMSSFGAGFGCHGALLQVE